MAPDLRGFGYTDKPGVAMGYDSRANAEDLAGLMTMLGFETFYVHGEDRKFCVFLLGGGERKRGGGGAVQH